MAMGEIAADMREGLLALAVGAGLQVMSALMEDSDQLAQARLPSRPLVSRGRWRHRHPASRRSDGPLQRSPVADWEFLREVQMCLSGQAQPAHLGPSRRQLPGGQHGRHDEQTRGLGLVDESMYLHLPELS